MKECFIISPIGEENSNIRKRSDEILNFIIKPVLNEFNYKTVRADEISEFGLITNQIIRKIAYSDLVICDLTYRNPNVYYELAVRHFVQKPIIQLIDENEEISFDIINTRTIKINHRNLTGANNARARIKDYLTRIGNGTYKIETSISGIIDFNATIFDDSPTHNISKAYSKIFDILKEQQSYFNNPNNIMSAEYIDKLKKADELQSIFLSNISHEIRMPVNAILGFSSFLIENNLDEQEKKDIVSRITNSTERLLNTMDNILDLSLIECNQIKITTSEVDVTKLTDDICMHYAKNLVKYKSEINIKVINLLESPINVVTDAYILKKLISVILDNAIKFTKKGSVEVIYQLNDKELSYSIKDTGIGISSENYSLIFEKFKQISSGYARKFEGNGIGLSIAKGLVQIIGGRIWLESQINIGTTFYFSIPVLKK